MAGIKNDGLGQTQERLLRLKHVLQLIPVSRSTWYAGVASGRYPQPTKSLGARITCWRESEILALIQGEG